MGARSSRRIGLGLIGFLDDWKKLKTRKGLSARQKFGAQLAVGRARSWPGSTSGRRTASPRGSPIPFFKGWLLTLGWLWIPFAVLVIVGASNAVNLTDGLDGLAIGPIVTAGGAFAVIAYLTGNFKAAEYLRILNVKGHGRADGLLRGARGRGAGLPLVQQLSRRRCSWATSARSRWAAPSARSPS